MKQMLEREVKLEPGDGFVLPELPGEPLEARIFTSTYHDTPPRSLARAGITLRRRLENGVSLWQLKLPREGGREEIEARGGPAGPPDDLRSLLAAHLRRGELEPVATLRTHRTGVRVKGEAGAVADVVIDAVDVLDNGHTAGGFTEIEVELVDGDDQDLQRLSRTLRRAGASRSPGTSKVMRILDLEEEQVPPAGAPFLAHVRFMLERQLRQLEAHDPGVRLGDDPEDVHRFRVATRRSRAVIRATRPLLGDRLRGLSEELRWLAGALAPVRDLDVLLARLRAGDLDEDASGAARILDGLARERDAARAAMLAVLEDQRYLALLDRFETEVASLPPLDGDAGVHEIAARELHRLRKAVDALEPEPTDDELHAVRIHAKRARYAAELAAPVEGKRGERFVEAAKHLQDVIGEHQDAVVAERRIRAVADERSALAAGRLVERERDRRRSTRADWPAAWAGVDKAGKRAFA